MSTWKHQSTYSVPSVPRPARSCAYGSQAAGADGPQLQQQEQGALLKECKGCGALKSRGEYHRNRSKPDGLEDKCKACKAKRDADRRSARPAVRAPQGSLQP